MPLILSTETNPGAAQWIESSLLGLSGAVKTLGLDPADAPTLVPASSRATGTVTVGSAPLGGGETLTIGSTTLTPAGGARTSGANDYDNTLGTVSALVDEIIQALNDPGNSFISPASSADAIIAYRGAASGDIEISSENAGFSGNNISLSAPGPGVTVSGPTLTGGGVVTSASIVFESPAEDLVLKQLFFFAVFGEGETELGPAFLLVTSISVDGGDNLVTGSMSVSVVDTNTPASSPEWNISLPAGSVVTVEVESLAPNIAVIPTWTAVPATSPLPSSREALGTTSALFLSPATSATATITVLGAPLPVAGDVLYFDAFNGRRLALTAQSGAVTPGDQFFDISSGVPATIASNIATAITTATDFAENGFTASSASDVVTVTAGAGDLADESYSITSVSAGLVASAFSGGTDSSSSMVFPAAPSDSILEQLFILAIGGEGVVLSDVFEISSITIDGGPNLIEGSISAALVSTTSLGESPRLDIPISAGEVVTVEIQNAAPFTAGAVGTWITRPA
jgi:hypothetical protein